MHAGAAASSGYGRRAKLAPLSSKCITKRIETPGRITYEIAIEADRSGRPFVLRERLRQRRKGQKYGRPFSFLMLYEGKGAAWKGEQGGYESDESKEWTDFKDFLEFVKYLTREESRETEIIELEDQRKLGIATLGSLAQHPRISAFRRFIEGWYLSYFSPDARAQPAAGRSPTPSQYPRRQSWQRRPIHGA